MAGAWAISRAGSLAAALALVALACGSETIDLLPDRSNGGGSAGTAGQSSAGSEPGGRSAQDSGGKGGSSSGSGGCQGSSCGSGAIAGFTGFGGAFWSGCPYGAGCQPC